MVHLAASRALLLAALLVIVPFFSACGEEQPGPSPGVTPQGELALGLEVWLPYDPPSTTRTLSPHLHAMEAARSLAEHLHGQALEGADVGAMARRHSGMPSGVADGLVALPIDPARPDARDRALMDVAVGAVTPLLDWHSGYWFARRIDAHEAARLKRILDTALQSEVRGQAIVILHKDAWPWRTEQRRTRERARERAEGLLSQLMAGADFEVLARETSEDMDSAARGGWIWAYDRATGKPSTPWVRWGCPDVPVSVVNHLLRGELGRPVPEVLDTLMGYVIVRPVERRHAGPPPGIER